MLEMNRRNLITGLVSLIAAPAIVRADSLMPVKLYDFTKPDPLIDELREAKVFTKTFRVIVLPSASTKAPIIQLIEELPKERFDKNTNCPLDSVKPPCDKQDGSDLDSVEGRELEPS